ncbi:hypothetical protein Bbelb_236330 [Branchiostoma belcheri]|nr:hypothetical protein Bbelb_236330 [Branchiostoma belcheri]
MIRSNQRLIIGRARSMQKSAVALSLRPEIGQSAERAPNTKNVESLRTATSLRDQKLTSAKPAGRRPNPVTSIRVVLHEETLAIKQTIRYPKATLGIDSPHPGGGNTCVKQGWCHLLNTESCNGENQMTLRKSAANPREVPDRSFGTEDPPGV